MENLLTNGEKMMDSVIEKRKAFIINFIYAVICIGLLYVFMKY